MKSTTTNRTAMKRTIMKRAVAKRSTMNHTIVNRALAVAGLLLALCVMSLAHGNEKHVLGVVTGISASSITIATVDHTSATVEVVASTKFEKSGAPAALKDLKVGDKLVVHADVVNGKLVANEVDFGASKKMQPSKKMEGMNHK